MAKGYLKKKGEEHVNAVSYLNQSEPDSSLYTTEYTLVINSDGN
jgi:hypothetical protein